jgi:hypothetical protein
MNANIGYRSRERAPTSIGGNPVILEYPNLSDMRFGAFTTGTRKPRSVVIGQTACRSIRPVLLPEVP